MKRAVPLVLTLLVLGAAPAAALLDPFQRPPPAQAERRMSRCQIEGDHVSGVVSVDLANGARSQIALVDVEAIVAMAPRLEDISVFVTAPLTFQGLFVPRDLGGPAAYVKRAFASDHVRLAANVPFEISLAPSGAEALVRVPTTYAAGAIEVTVPCGLLRAGTPSARVRAPSAPRGTPHVLAIAPSSQVFTTPRRDGRAFARIGLDDAQDTRSPVYVIGALEPSMEGFVHVTIAEGPVTLDGFMVAASVRVSTDPVQPHATGRISGGPTNARDLVRVRLPVGTPIFGDVHTSRTWASVARPFDAMLRPSGENGRVGLVLPSVVAEGEACRFDGVRNRPFCGPRARLPQVGRDVCGFGGCADVAFVTPP